MAVWRQMALSWKSLPCHLFDDQLGQSRTSQLPYLCEMKVTQSCLTLRPHGLHSPWNSPGQNTGVGSLSLLQGIFPTQGSNPGLLHCRRILHQLSHKGSSRILDWIAYPFSRGSSQPRNQTGVSCIAGGFMTKRAYLCNYGNNPPRPAPEAFVSAK